MRAGAPRVPESRAYSRARQADRLTVAMRSAHTEGPAIFPRTAGPTHLCEDENAFAMHDDLGRTAHGRERRAGIPRRAAAEPGEAYRRGRHHHQGHSRV